MMFAIILGIIVILGIIGFISEKYEQTVTKPAKVDNEKNTIKPIENKQLLDMDRKIPQVSNVKQNDVKQRVARCDNCNRFIKDTDSKKCICGNLTTFTLDFDGIFDTNNCVTGFGTLYYKTRIQYVGEFKDGKYHGKGKLYKEFLNEHYGIGRINRISEEQPIYSPPNKVLGCWEIGRWGVEYEGYWINGKKHGYGKDYKGYEGQFKNDEYNGYGKSFYERCGNKYRDEHFVRFRSLAEGEFVNGRLKSGKRELFYQYTENGEWRLGQTHFY